MAGQAEEPGERLQIGGFHHYHSLVRQPITGTCTRGNTYIGGSQRPSPPRKNAISTMYVSPPA